MSITISAETIVNTTTVDDQVNPFVTMLNDGGWVVTWQSANQDGDLQGIYQQRYDAQGQMVGVETLVNTEIVDNQRNPVVTALADGGWLVAWQSFAQDGDLNGVYFQRYDKDSITYGKESLANNEIADNQSNPVVAGLPDGGWLVAWRSVGQDGGNGGIYYQRYDSSGKTVGPETLVNTETAGNQINPAIQVLENGDWVIAWQSNGQDGDGFGIYQQLYHNDDNTYGQETQVSTFVTGGQIQPQIAALADGGFVVTWQSDQQDGDGWGIFQQRFAANGTKMGGEIMVNSQTMGDQSEPVTAGLADGGWMVSWTVTNPDMSLDIFQRHFDADGNAQEVETIVNAMTGDNQSNPAVAMLADGDWLVAWQSTNQDEPGMMNGGIYMRTVHYISDAPTGSDNTITMKEDTKHIFSIDDFGFFDEGGNDFTAVVISEIPAAGALLLNGLTVTADQTINVADLGKLTWQPDENANGEGLAALSFQVVDNGDVDGLVNIDPEANTITFDVTEVVDRFIGTNAANKRTGTDGDDYFLGKRGKDTLTGLGGSDVFVFRNGDGKDKITDFTAAGEDHDVLNLSRFSPITNFKDLMQHHVKDTAAGLLIDGHNGHSIFLVGLDKADLASADFIF